MPGAALVVGLLLATQPALSEQQAVDMANNAFEYRDFAKVVEILRPLVHPPRISDPALMLRARRLLGVALHIRGDIQGAREEFSLVLLQQPKDKLDPFTVPPAVIETFEAVRRQMAPALDKRTDRTEPTGARVVKVIEVPDQTLAWIPFGYVQLFVLEDQLGWGLTWLGTQLLGLALNIGSYIAANAIRENGFVPRNRVGAFNTAVGLMYAGAGVFAASYIGNVVQGNFAVRREAGALRESATPVEPSGAKSTVWFNLTIPFD